MNIQQVIDATERLLLEHREKSLSDLEREILQSTLQDVSYERIAKKMECSLSSVSIVGAKLWSDLSKILCTEINKRNFKSIIERVDIEHDISDTIKDLQASNILASNILKGDLIVNISSEELESEKYPSESQELPTDHYVETAPECLNFYGRKEELKTLKNWILKEGDRIITILGFPGIGKTSLSLKLAEQMKPHFDAIVYRSLNTNPTFHAFLIDILESLGYKKDNNLNNLDKHISRFKRALSHRKYLFILDDFENIFACDKLAGTYLKKQEKYQLLFDIFATTSHQSCLLLCSREKPDEIAQLEGEKSPVRSLALKGAKEIAIALFREKKLQDEKSWQTLIDMWRGNPLQLKEAALLIQNIFDGDASQFMAYSEDFIGNNLQRKIEQHLERLSESERDVIQAFEGINYALPIGKLMSNSGLLPAEFLNVLQSLQSRFCLETEQKDKIKHFSLIPVLKNHLKANPLE